MGRVLSLIVGAVVVFVALAAAAWRIGVAVKGERAPEPAQIAATAPHASPFGGAPRNVEHGSDAIPAPPLAEVPQMSARRPPFGDAPPGVASPDLRAGLAPEESGVIPFSPDTPLARAAPEMLALVPVETRPPSPFDTLEPLLPPVRPNFDDLLEAPAAPLPPRRPSDLAVTPQAPAPQPQPPGAAPAQPPAPTPTPTPTPTPSVVALAPTAAPPPVTPAPSVAPPPGPDVVAPVGPAGNGQIGSPVFVRIFKREGTLELYVRNRGRFALKKSFPVCKMSGRVGPKLKSGDYQAPEGFYSVTTRQLNPKSQYHLAFNVGFPNAFDRQNGRTGSAIMVHGDCVSIGCFAMTNKGIEEIYGYVAAALKNGQREVPVHIFPFHMSESAIARESGGGGFASLFSAAARDSEPSGGTTQWGDFWRDLKKGYDLFERTGEPPLAYACKGRYAFSPGPGCQRIAGW